MAESEDESRTSPAVWLPGLTLWQGIRMEPTEANHKSTSVPKDKMMMVRRAHAILRARAGRCRLSTEAVFSPAVIGRRASEEGELPPLRVSMVEKLEEEMVQGLMCCFDPLEVFPV